MTAKGFEGAADGRVGLVGDINRVPKAEVTEGRVDFGARFGGVNCRGRGVFGARQDLWLPVEAVPVAKALREVASEERLGPLLRELVGPGALLHEVSCLVSDPGAPRQCVHADTIVLPSPQFPNASMEPLYTFFVALQDVEDDMGHTVFLPRTHTPRAHEIWNGPQRQKEMFISVNDATQSNLDLGDVAIFDSRLLHCGRENSSDKRRVLFYFTVSAQHDWPLPNGKHGSNSIRAEDRGKWTLRDFGLDEAVAEGDPASKSRRDVLVGRASLPNRARPRRRRHQQQLPSCRSWSSRPPRPTLWMRSSSGSITSQATCPRSWWRRARTLSTRLQVSKRAR